MKNVLLIGDLRTHINNYGACATSDSLIGEINKKNVTLKCIDGRSFWNETPSDGWDLGTDDYISKAIDDRKNEDRIKAIKRIIKKVPGAVQIARRIKKNMPNIFVPYKYHDYEAYADRVLRGEKLQYEHSLISWADVVLINSEGNIVRGTDKYGYYRLGGLYVLFMAYLSKIVNKKPTYIINHTVDPGNRDVIEIIKNIYPLMDGIYIREKMSIKLLKEWGITNAKLVADALFLYNRNENKASLPQIYTQNRDYKKRFICIGDSSGIENSYTKVKWDVKDFYKRLISLLKEQGYQIAFVDGFNGVNYEINEIIKTCDVMHLKISNCSYSELYQVFKESDIYISGRWHTSILALQADTPILLWGADSHKTEALYDLIDYPFRFFDVNSLPLHVEDIVAEAEKIIKSDNNEIFGKVSQLTEDAAKIVDMLEE